MLICFQVAHPQGHWHHSSLVLVPSEAPRLRRSCAMIMIVIVIVIIMIMIVLVIVIILVLMSILITIILLS